MSNVPILKRFTISAPSALNSFVNSTDDETSLTFLRVTSPNTILDIVNDPDPASGVRYEIRLIKQGIDTGRRFYSTSMSPASAGRISVGPINLSQGDYTFSVAQRAGTLASYSFVVKLARSP